MSETSNIYIMVKGKTFGKTNFREKIDNYGKKVISFNMEILAPGVKIGGELKNLKLATFPSFRLPKEKSPRNIIEVGNQLIMPVTFAFRAGKEMGEDKDFIINSQGYREDVIKNLRFNYVNFDTDQKLIVKGDDHTPCNFAAGTLRVEYCKKVKPGGMMIILSEGYVLRNVDKDDPERNSKIFRKQYYRAYTPIESELPIGNMVAFKGCVIPHPFKEEDKTAFLYIDQIFN